MNLRLDSRKKFSESFRRFFQRILSTTYTWLFRTFASFLKYLFYESPERWIPNKKFIHFLVRSFRISCEILWRYTRKFLKCLCKSFWMLVVEIFHELLLNKHFCWIKGKLFLNILCEQTFIKLTNVTKDGNITGGFFD